MKKSYSSAVFLLTLLGFVLRLTYLTTTHPFFDEYTTVLAAREILRRGWPMLPSGLFYEHGLLSTYLIAPFTALFIDMPLAAWQPAHWGLMLSRWPSLLISTATIPLIYTLGRRSFNLITPSPSGRGESRQRRGEGFTSLSSPICLLAAGLFAFSPEGVVWGGRARMYALATLLVLLAVYWAYRGALYPAPARYRWLAWLALLLALLTQLGVLTLIPPLIIGMIAVGWFSSRVTCHVSRITYHVSPVTFKLPDAWFLRPAVLWEGLAVAIIVGIAIYVKRLGQPMGLAPVNAPGSGFVLIEMLKTVAYQTTFHLNWADTIKFLSREFGVPHHFWLALMAVVGGIVNLAIWLWEQIRNNKLEIRSRIEKQSSSIAWLFSNFYFLISLVFGLILLEMVVFLDPFRHNPRYLVMYLPLFYLIAASAIFSVLVHVSRFTFISDKPFRIFGAQLRNTQYVIRLFPTLVAIILLVLFTIIGWPDLRLALLTPEPAYEEALAFVRAEWQPGDVVLTMNTSAAALYLGRADGFTLQNDADQFLLTTGAGQVDRWLGVPWLANAADFNAALNANPRAWFVIDTIRLPVYFRGDWLTLVNNQMEQAWAKDNALVYLTRPDRIPLPTRPETPVKATLGKSIELTGYTLAKINQDLRLTLFWQPLITPPADYTTFVHLRNGRGVTVAQRDSQPLEGVYPTGRWQPGEIVIDPFTLSLPADLPAGTYSLVIGLYQLDTMQRLPVANDTSGENAIVLGEVKLP